MKMGMSYLAALPILEQLKPGRSIYIIDPKAELNSNTNHNKLVFGKSGKGMSFTIKSPGKKRR